MLHATGFMMAVSLSTIVLYTLAASAMALAMGVFYPQFETENAAQIPTSLGGLLFMMMSICLLGLIIASEAGPVATYLGAQQSGRPLEMSAELVVGLGSVAVLCVGTMVVSLRLALRKLEALEV
jgi:ABC-2 type transport system permease protein